MLQFMPQLQISLPVISWKRCCDLALWTRNHYHRHEPNPTVPYYLCSFTSRPKVLSSHCDDHVFLHFQHFYKRIRQWLLFIQRIKSAEWWVVSWLRSHFRVWKRHHLSSIFQETMLYFLRDSLEANGMCSTPKECDSFVYMMFMLLANSSYRCP